jgi:lipoprotein-anchoring transpeptidase ErfK/SrfK
MSRNRFSRSLVGLLVLTLVAGAGLYVRGVLQARPAVARGAALPAVPTGGPTGGPTGAASTPLASAAPTTGPAPTITITPAPAQAFAPPPMLAAQTAPTSQPGATLAAWSPTPTPVPSAPPANFLAEASTKSSTGDLLGARKMLNDALLSNQLSPTDTAATKKAMTDLNDQLVFGPRKFPADEYGGTYPVKPGEQMKKIAASYDLTWQFLAKINSLSDPRKMQAGVSLKVIKGPFNVVVNKKAFTMDIYLGGTPGQPGSMYVRSFPVGLGREDSTPTGTWLVDNHKVRNPIYYSPRGEGVIAANDPKNPLGHCWIGLSGVDGKAVGQQSYGIHGTIDPDSIGKQASMGCIRMHNEDADVVFDLVAEGKSMVIVKD